MLMSSITVVDADVAVEIATTLGNQTISAVGESIWSIFLVALIGGLILNIMPCVLPVLGMKLSSVSRCRWRASVHKYVNNFWLLVRVLLAHSGYWRCFY